MSPNNKRDMSKVKTIEPARVYRKSRNSRKLHSRRHRRQFLLQIQSFWTLSLVPWRCCGGKSKLNLKDSDSEIEDTRDTRGPRSPEKELPNKEGSFCPTRAVSAKTRNANGTALELPQSSLFLSWRNRPDQTF